MALRLPSLALLALSLVAIYPNTAFGLVQKYCSNHNTADDHNPTYWQYQSNGWCHDHCVDGYAFAVVMGTDCWCSNYIPVDQLDIKECNDICPGFGDESCGNADGGLFGYIEINNKPSGTATGFLASKTGDSKPKTTNGPPPITSIQVITESGAAVTKTIMIYPTDNPKDSKKGVSGGTIAGAVVGSLAGLVAVGGILVWYLGYRRRKQGTKDSEQADGGSPGVSPQRQPSTLSKSGLLRSEKDYPRIAIPAPAPTRHSSNGTNGASPASHGSERRHSKPLFYDQRLNPSALMDLDNGSHTSILTIEDNRDYTRTLNVRNPDPPEE